MSATTRDPLAVTGVLLEGKYNVEQAIGEGGAAIVYRGRHVQAGALVAIKFLITLGQAPESERPAIMEEFRREARLIAELSTRSSAIVQARDFGVLERPGHTPLPYLVLEWLAGSTLDEVIVNETNTGKPPRTLKEAAQLLEPVAGALAIAHERNVAHRDVKPENVFVLTGDGTQPGARIKLLDFGIAKVMQTRASGLQQTGTLPTAFTPHYGAPEQFSRTYGETGPWTDVFAMALVIIEVMQGGRRAFVGDDYMELARQSCDDDRRPTLRTLKHPCSDAVEAVFARALAVQPLHRYPTMREFWTALLGAVNPQAESFPLTGPSAALAAKRHSNPPSAATPSSFSNTAAQPGGSRRIILGALVIGTLAIVGAAVVAGIKASAPGATSEAPPAVSSPAAPEPTVAPSGSLTPTTEVNLCPQGALVVSGGRFTMGSDDPVSKDDAPAHNAFVDTYCLDRTEVTVAAYTRCVSAGSCAAIVTAGVQPAGKCTSDSSALTEHPLNCASFDEATTFCAFRGMRLPTEAEWELAARRGGELPWDGSDPTERANLDGKDGFDFTAPAGSFAKGASKDGVLDLIGNVAEWTGDWFGPYASEDMVNPKGPGAGSKRSVRGGAWSGTRVEKGAALSRLTATFREALRPEARSAAVGFRCAKSLR